MAVTTQVVARLPEQYDALTLYFADVVLSERLACETIFERLNDPTTKFFLQFLDFVLLMFNILKKQMQSESPQIHVMYKSVTCTLKSLLECYLCDEYLQKTPLSGIPPCDSHNFRSFTYSYVLWGQGRDGTL